MMRRSPPHLFTPLTDDQWLALLPYVFHRAPAGRQVGDLRLRMNAIFHHAHTNGAPWHTLPAHYGKADTVHRFFRRLTHAGLWHRLLEALHDSGPNHALKTLEHAICRATRRAARLGGLRLIYLIRKLNLESALNGPPWLLPNPNLSELCVRSLPTSLPTTLRAIAALKPWLKALHQVSKDCEGRRRIPHHIRWAW